MTTKNVFIDVDQTLIIWKGKGTYPKNVEMDEYHKYCDVNKALVDRIREWKRKGFMIIIWSGTGKEHAEWAANHAGVSEFADAILPKPYMLVDDKGLEWGKHKGGKDFLILSPYEDG